MNAGQYGREKIVRDVQSEKEVPLYKFWTEDIAETEMLPFEAHEQTGAFSK